MEIIVHRVNKIKDLIKTPQNYGVEIDLRDFGKDLVLEHDPFKRGQSFEKYLKKYHHGTLILNVKSERIEYRIIDLLKKYMIFMDNLFFFLVFC